MNNQQKLLSGESSVAIVGLGYVGLPIAVAFAKNKVNVIGLDLNAQKVSELKEDRDHTGEVSTQDLIAAKPFITYTTDAAQLKKASFIIVAVPTPIDSHKKPDLSPLEGSSTTIGKNLSKGTTVVYESTVYPGVTEEYCLPILEKHSGLKLANGDFFIGYSPERINPGDKQHTLEKIIKVVSGQNEEVCEDISKVYEIVVKAGTFKATSIKVAEAAKVIENTQRDLNIALMNELSIIFNRMGISTKDVLDAAGTKWNFLKFTPGLVGGHCIGVDPYYLTSKSEQLGYHPEVVLAGRRINDNMGSFVTQQTIRLMIKNHQRVTSAKIAVLGLTFKENVPDFRNSKVFDVIRELSTYGIEVIAHDPFLDEADPEEIGEVPVTRELKDISDCNGIIIATSHDQYRQESLSQLRSLCLKDVTPVFIDIKWAFERKECEAAGFAYWSL